VIHRAAQLLPAAPRNLARTVTAPGTVWPVVSAVSGAFSPFHGADHTADTEANLV